MIAERCMRSEILLSCALGGREERFGTCIAVVNDALKLLGDYNRLFLRTDGDLPAVLADIEAVQARFERLGIPRVKVLEVFPNVSPSLIEGLAGEGNEVSEHTFFALSEAASTVQNRGGVEVPSLADYMAWYDKKYHTYEGFTEECWLQERSLRPGYLAVFQPYWLFVDGAHAGYGYCAETDAFTCVHDVNVLPEFRGHGYGLALISEMVKGKRRPVVLRAGRTMERFYGKLGFAFACANKVVQLGEP